MAAHPPPPTHPPRCLFGENKNKNHATHLHVCMSRRYAGRRYAGLGPSRVRTRIPTTRWLGQWVSLRKIVRGKWVGMVPTRTTCQGYGNRHTYICDIIVLLKHSKNHTHDGLRVRPEKQRQTDRSIYLMTKFLVFNVF